MEAGRLRYKDFDGIDTVITWYQYNDAITSYHDFCGTSNPMSIQWYGDRYDPIRPSRLSIRLVMRDDADKAALDQILSRSYCVTVNKNGLDFWFGKMHPQFFTEAYEPYGFPIEITASDHLGQFGDNKPTMQDFPAPFIEGAPEYNLLEFFNRLLTDPTIIPSDAVNRCAPEFVNISCRAYHAFSSQWQAFEDTYLDPLNFMRTDADEYKTKKDIIDAILKILYAKLFQWDGDWWIMSLDSQWNAGEIIYRKFQLDYTIGPVFLAETVINPPIIEICDGDIKKIRDKATLSYEANWESILYTKKYQENTCNMQVYANRRGNYYNGESTDPLEILPIPVADRLNHWASDPLQGGLTVFPYPFNDTGNLGISLTYERSFHLENSITSFNIPGDVVENMKDFTLSFYYDLTTVSDSEWWMNIRYTSFDPGGTQVRYLENDNNVPTWRNTATTYKFYINYNDRQKVASISFGTPYTDILNYPHPGELWIQIFRPTLPDGATAPWNDRNAIINSFVLSINDNDWSSINFEETVDGLFDPVSINPLGQRPPQSLTLDWGIVHRDFDNKHIYHLSAPYNLAGDPLETNWQLQGREGLSTQRSLLDWLHGSYHEDNFDFSAKITAELKGELLTPLNIISEIIDPGVTTTVAEYNYSTPISATPPAVGEIIHSDNEINRLFINKTDANTIGRNTLLSSLKNGDSITVGGTTWTITSTINSGLYYEVFITPPVQHTPDGLHAFTFTVNTAFIARYYSFVNGEYHDRTGIWQTNHVEAKWLKNVPYTVLKGDFSSTEFDESFSF